MGFEVKERIMGALEDTPPKHKPMKKTQVVHIRLSESTYAKVIRYCDNNMRTLSQAIEILIIKGYAVNNGKEEL